MLKIYTYTCEKHPVGEYAREIAPDEAIALARFSRTVAHAGNCWVRGCQEEAAQVRIVEVQAGSGT